MVLLKDSQEPPQDMQDPSRGDSSDLRRRGGVNKSRPDEAEASAWGDSADDRKKMEAAAKTKSSAGVQPGRSIQRDTYWLTRIVLLRYMGFIYCVAFLVAYHQNKQLIGNNGLLPANNFLNNVKAQAGNKITWTTVTQVPSILWLFDHSGHKLDVLLDRISFTGLCLSAFVLVYGAANWFIMLTLWALYHSLVNVGQRWYGFGWESQILETGFLATFLCPVWSFRRLPRSTPTSTIVIFGFRWLIFRIMIGAGLIKIRGDKCWRDLTCMNYHYETQPVPNPLSYYMHQSPAFWHQVETMGNHFIELIAPVLLIIPYAPLRNIGGAIQILFQVVLILSGNLSFLNWLTILPCLACFDDVSLSWMFPRSVLSYVKELQHTKTTGAVPKPRLGNYIRGLFNVSLGLLIAYLSVPVVSNLLSPRQAMNTSFDPLRLVNTYGAFGSITKKRHEVIFQGTSSADPHSPNALWEDYEFKCKPGNVSRTPCIISPYHYRLDWLMWFAAFQSYERNPWLVHLAVKLLVNDEGATSLIEHNPFMGKDPPKFIRAEHYRYRYTKLGSPEAKKGQWWRRKREASYMPPLSLQTARPILRQMGWPVPKVKKT